MEHLHNILHATVSLSTLVCVNLLFSSSMFDIEGPNHGGSITMTLQLSGTHQGPDLYKKSIAIKQLLIYCTWYRFTTAIRNDFISVNNSDINSLVAQISTCQN